MLPLEYTTLAEVQTKKSVKSSSKIIPPQTHPDNGLIRSLHDFDLIAFTSEIMDFRAPLCLQFIKTYRAVPLMTRCTGVCPLFAFIVSYVDPTEHCNLPFKVSCLTY